jgi:transposase InsO family protein
MARTSKSPATRAKRKSRPLAFPVEFRLRIVKLYLEEGYSPKILVEQFGISTHSIQRWVRAYRLHGATGLEPKRPVSRKSRVAEEIRQQAVAVKAEHPEYGPRRISDFLKRFFLMRTSPATVHKTLAAKGLVKKAPVKPEKNPAKPRFFERARPNQLWQSDILTIRLGGHNAYLIGFIDDYSRYITALGLYRSQTAEHVLETYRRAVADYGVPKEVLTDNGRQYTNWRGKTRFEQELEKDRVKHIRSRPHHPMTLGKIERFWKSLLGEFLQRAQFDSFEQAVERTALWVKYYNHKRPHQGIGGLCPADRFFEIAHELKQTIEKGLEQNALELALRGRPVDPFYMVGRMGGQSVVIRAEKGKVRMLVDGEAGASQKELVYDTRKDIDHEHDQNPTQELRASAEDNRGALDLERAADERAALSGDGHQPGPPWPVAESGDRGNAPGAGPQAEGSAATDQPAALAADREEACRLHGEAGEAVASNPEAQGGDQPLTRDGGDETGCEHPAADGPAAGRGDHEGALRAIDGPAGSRASGSLPQDLLQVGGAGALCAAIEPCGSGEWPALPAGGLRETGSGAAVGAGPSGVCHFAAQDGAKGCAERLEVDPRYEPGGKKMSASSGCSP